ncbi:phage tail fiber protein [Candidatus Termititenax aidoneus]|uniref:Phage tail fiber protein n=1 Tax=Termititenax aidoneus TaxID=2218524 RepID=A0A388T9H4_TERA1|nr:phage tail fiber protein [Candidatus Termititenax aidoneus]
MANATGSYSDNFEETPYYIKRGEPLSAEGMNAALNTREKITHKEVYNTEADVLSASNDYYPSSKLVKESLSAAKMALEESIDALSATVSSKEDASNKTGDLDSGGSNAALYPTAQAVKTALDGKENASNKAAIITDVNKDDAVKYPTTGAVTAWAENSNNKATSITTANKDDAVKYPTTGAVTAWAATALMDILLPKGMIIAMENATYYNNASAEFKAKWKICDGGNGTPDLRHKFLRGYQSGDVAAGGADSRSFGIGTNNLPNHNHTFSGTTATGRLPCLGSMHYRDVGANGRPPSGVFSEGSRDGYVVGFEKWFPNEPGLSFSMTPQGSVTGGGSTTPDRITVETVPSYYTVIYVMKVA